MGDICKNLALIEKLKHVKGLNDAQRKFLDETLNEKNLREIYHPTS